MQQHQQDCDAAGGTSPALAIAALDPPLHVGIGFPTQFLARELSKASIFFRLRVLWLVSYCLRAYVFFVLLCASQAFRPLLNISAEFSVEELETALITPNDTLSDIHIPLLKVGRKGL